MNELSAPGRLSILGVHVSVLTMQRATATMEHWIRNGERRYVCITGVHGVMESQRDPELMAIHNAAGLVTADGMPMVWMSHWLGHPEAERVYGPDLLQEMSRISAVKGYRNFFYGSSPGTLGNLTAALSRRHSGLQIVGSFSPPFRPLTPEEDEAVIAQINASGAQVVWVGLSTPKQERWMASHVHRLNASVLVGVGAAFDFAAGEKQQAPRWMQRNGLEWAFRLATEPRRLAGRYFRNNPAFMLRASGQLLRHHAISRLGRANRMAP